MATYDKQSIPSHVHERMKQLAKLNNRPIIKEYEAALDNWIQQQTQDILLADSQILNRMEERITKAEERLARMNGRTGMDVSIVLTGILNLLAKQHQVTEKQIYEELRPIAASHFSRSKQDF
ncbi:hypothetical protein [Paenibacillus alvei]|uniref:hypothetical protein n=1 Tax=Paenibacillus alvei TaxID=44250 RepID=UPI002281FE14|nr:hypothetical protein [Paenibacillus alvei]